MRQFVTSNLIWLYNICKDIWPKEFTRKWNVVGFAVSGSVQLQTEFRRNVASKLLSCLQLVF